MSRLRRMITNGTLLLAGIVIAVGLLEIGLRTAAWVLVRSRAPARLATASTTGTIRILCLGESTTFGTGRAEHTYPTQLERLLNERGDGHRYVVVNAGVPATTTDRIVAALESNLDKYRPDVVVTMMGINDGPVDDAMFAVSDSFRVVKLGRLLAATAAHALGADEDLPEVASIPREGGRPVTGVPRTTAHRLYFASLNVLAGRLDEAERQLTPFAETPSDHEGARAVATEAEGQLALVNAQRKRPDDADRHRRRYGKLVGPQLNPATATNYRTLARILAARGIPLVAVEYPARDAGPLRDLVGGADNVVVVDNEDTFLRASAERPLKEIYQDLFAGIFGHMTPAGNQLLAANVAAAVASIAGPARPPATTP